MRHCDLGLGGIDLAWLTILVVEPYFSQSFYRLSSVSSNALALGARSVGHYKVRAGFRDLVMRKSFTQLFWSVEGEGRMMQDGKPQTLEAGFVALYFPGEVHEVWHDGPGEWEYRWWTLDGDTAVSLVNAFGFTKGETYRVGSPPIDIFNCLEAAIRDVSPSGEFEASACAYKLLCAAASAARTGANLSSKDSPNDTFRLQVSEIIRARWADPLFGVEEIADLLGVHRSKFSRHFQAAFGLPPSLYLQRWRVQNALSALKETRYPIHEVARRCGWDDANYFARCIKKATGCSPLQFRKA